ncbi:MAG: serine/threonine-protein kinase, partial [Streptosporangiaceae bacterium]
MDALLPSDPEYIGRYRLVGRLGGGGMGQVYLARSPGGRSVAVKVIREPLSADPGFRTRFAREIAAARRVSGIFTAPVVDADPDADRPWLVTAYVDGPSLAEAVEQSGPLPADLLVPLVAGLAEGLAAIHSAGLVHRDLKPSNVLLAADGPRIIDFGIARASDATALTHTGTIVGSPGFMSPEQAEGRPVGPASDIFSLGSVLTFAATGAGPFGSGQPSTLLYRVVHTRPATAGIPAPMRALIERCLAKDPAARPTAESVLAGMPPTGAAWRQPATAVR